MYKERINYIKDGKHYVGVPVNIRGVVIQADTLEELKEKGKSLCKSYLSFLSETIDQEEPFELHEQPDFEIWLYGEKEAELRRELQKYKDMFGEL